LTRLSFGRIFTHMDECFGALADATRRAIVGRLALGEARVTDVAAPFDMSLNSVSKHIRMLERAGLVRRRIEGREHFLSLNPEPMGPAIAWMEEQAALWRWRLGQLQKVLDDDG
jgi:DNA-binding transcriptional ArsR family regulator